MKELRQKITLKSEKVEYVIRKNRRAKSLKLSISCDGNFVVTLPWHMSVWSAERFVREHAEWVLEKLKKMRAIAKRNPLVRSNPRQYLQLKEYARAVVMRRLQQLNARYGFAYGSVSIRNQKTRWGSCSSKGNLNFNYKVVLLPPRHRDYIIVHELCHLEEFNHSCRFWKLVERTFPDYEELVSDLRALQQ